MTDIVSKYYVTRQGCADRASALAHVEVIGDELSERYDAGEILGYETAVLATDEDYRDDGLEWARARMVDAAGGEPMIWINVTFAAPGPVGDGLRGLVELRELHPVVMDPWGGD